MLLKNYNDKFCALNIICSFLSFLMVIDWFFALVLLSHAYFCDFAFLCIVLFVICINKLEKKDYF